jgi:DNA polymerase III gamma/tau subunit
MAGNWAKSFDVGTLEKLVIFLRKREIDFSAAKIPKLFLEACLIEMMQLLQNPSTQQLRQPESPPQPQQAKTQPQKPKVDATPFNQVWEQIKVASGMERLTPLIASYSYHPTINELVITLPEKYRAGRDKAIQRIQDACVELKINLSSIDVEFI